MNRLILCLTLSALSASAIAQQRETTICSPQQSQQNWSNYVNKYKHAEDALACAGFPGLAPTRGGGGTQCQTYTPHPAVKHAAEVDAPVRGRGGALCRYIDTEQNRKWYADNFRLTYQPRSR
jgi:hypothetical protein